MQKYKKLLVAYDGSDSSKAALRLAISVARAEKAWIKALAVAPDYEGDIELTGVKDLAGILRGAGERLLSEAISIANAERALVLTDIEQGEPYDRIVSVAERERCDLIVMGRGGRHGQFIGSVTERVIGHSAKDVMVVPAETIVGTFKRVLLATDGSSHAAMAEALARSICQTYSARLAVLSVVDTNDEFFSEAPDLVQKLVEAAQLRVGSTTNACLKDGIEAVGMVREGEPYAKIIEAAQETGADLIVMGTHGRTGLSRLLLGSVAERVIPGSPCPILVSKGYKETAA